MPRIAIAHQLRARTSSMIFSIALACAPANTTIAHWQFAYPYSGALEEDRVYTQGEDLFYARTQGGLTLRDRMRCDNVREVTMNETTTEIHVQIWGIRNTSVLVLHFTKVQRELATRIAHDLQRLEYGVYLPMQNRAKMPVSSSSFAASPVS